VLVGVDDIPTRWDVQLAAPGWVCVAGTSHLFALITAHEQGQPCTGCAQAAYPVQFSVDYPDRPLNRLTTAFRIFVAIPILIVLGAVSAGTWQWSNATGTTVVAAGAGGLLFFGPLLRTWSSSARGAPRASIGKATGTGLVPRRSRRT
jgi:hypothetical protein